MNNEFDAFAHAIKIYRSPDDIAFSLADQFRVIADRIEEDVPTIREEENN